MSKQVRWILAIFFCLLTGLALQKGFELLSTQGNIDGSGIGISFLGMEINDSVNAIEIGLYTKLFFGLGVISIIAAVLLGLTILKKPKTQEA